MTLEQIILFSVLTPFIAAALIPLFWRTPNIREAVSLAAGVILVYFVASIYPTVADGNRPSVEVLEMLPGLGIVFTVEPLGMIFAGIASFLWVVTSIYSIGYMRGHNEQNQTRFYAFFAIALGSAIGIAFAGNMLTLFLFYEVLTLSTFPLVTHHGDEKSKRAGRVYLGILLGTSIAFQLTAIIWTWSLAGTLDFTQGGILSGKAEGLPVAILLGLYAFGIGKAALMPFHRWLPAAMVAPTPVSALLHAVAVVKAGVFSVVKVVVYIFGIDFLFSLGASQWLQYVAAATIIIASLVAMTKDNLKARLAYSTISQLSYIVLGAMLVTDLSIIGGGMHIVTHAFGKITLFFCAGAFMVAAHKTEISQMRGIGQTMPFTTAAFLIGSLSIIGLPPFGGLWSKWYLVMGAIDVGQLFMVGVLLVSSILNVAYLLPIPVRGFFSSPDENPPVVAIHDHDPEHDHTHDLDQPKKIREAPLPCLIAIGITSAGCLFLFFFPDPIFDLLQQIVVP
ncbi:MAG: monovalent cation/H+ antiporter subunit D family protein [Proteobacteria bacterium]|nr:monovalent cation/H+ antiporter subunit D family protein [Pseudomonadota bacterium]MDA1023136.1 monovalent cation/H+ antiporter subunit D family protein [Pseudomonadota bacterium]